MRLKTLSLSFLLISMLFISGCLSESVELKVATEGAWNGSCVLDGGEAVPLSGEGPATVPLGTDHNDVVCTLQKAGSSAEKMAVSLYRGDKLLVEGNTSVPNGMVVFACNLTTDRYELKSHTDGPKEYLLSVRYDGPWEAAIPSDEGVRSVNGSGWQLFSYNSSDLTVQMGARKLDASNNSLTVGIHDAHLGDLAVNSTSEPNGAVSVSYDVEPDLIFRSGVKIVISSEEDWKGWYDVDGNYTAIERFEDDEIYYLGDVSGPIRLGLRKSGNDDAMLSVSIEKDGAVIEHGETSTRNGSITLRADL